MTFNGNKFVLPCAVLQRFSSFGKRELMINRDTVAQRLFRIHQMMKIVTLKSSTRRICGSECTNQQLTEPLSYYALRLQENDVHVSYFTHSYYWSRILRVINFLLHDCNNIWPSRRSRYIDDWENSSISPPPVVGIASWSLTITKEASVPQSFIIVPITLQWQKSYSSPLDCHMSHDFYRNMPHLKFVGTSPSWEKASVMKLDMRGLHDNLREKLDRFCDSGAIGWDVLQFFPWWFNPYPGKKSWIYLLGYWYISLCCIFDWQVTSELWDNLWIWRDDSRRWWAIIC